jgi:hypothetical protein
MKVMASSIIEVYKGMIIQERDYYDNTALLKKLGVIDI